MKSKEPPRVLKFGLPAGSLKEMTLSLMRKAGYPFAVGSRSYVPVSGDPEISARMLSLIHISEPTRPY